MKNLNIKSMKLYNHVDRIFNEIHELGKNNSEPLLVNELSNFDQLHYYGTEAIDYAINKIGIDSNMSILEIGSGIGGPARYIANSTGANVVALELQHDQNKIASILTNRCGLSDKITHLCGNFLTYKWKKQTFDVIVSWLTLYHISKHDKLLKKCFDLLKPKGFFYTEDLIIRKILNQDELNELSNEIYAKNLLNYQVYKSNIKKIGYKYFSCQDMSKEWTDFTRSRAISYQSHKDRHIRVHGEDIFKNLNSFYSFINYYFSTGKLGGIRIIAKKN